jgi:hypothetical protein
MKTRTIHTPEELEKKKVCISIAEQLYHLGALFARRTTNYGIEVDYFMQCFHPPVYLSGCYDRPRCSSVY